MTVTDNPTRRRYEAIIDGEVAGYVYYQLREGKVALIHTEVELEREGEGVGSRLAAATLDDIRARGLQIIPVCPFIRSYLKRHPEYQDLVA